MRVSHKRAGTVVLPVFVQRHRSDVITSMEKIALLFLCVLCVVVPFILDVRVDAPAGVTQEEGHTGFLIHLPSAVLALIFLTRRIQPFLSLVGRDVEFCVPTN